METLNIFFKKIHLTKRTLPLSYSVGTGGSFPGGKAAEDWIWPLTSI